jgi:TM2 domain-containing membrane protein YozV
MSPPQTGLARPPFRTHVSGVPDRRPLPDPGLAAVLSFIIPGLGQFYNGKFLRGIFWLIVTPGLWLGSAGTLGWICHVIAAYTAYTYARSLHRDARV